MTTYQGNPAHDGRVADPALRPPLQRRWSRRLGGPVSYPVVAGGRAFVTVASANTMGTVLRAFRAATGRSLWRLPLAGGFWWSGLAYDSGRLFVVTDEGLLLRVAPATGRIVWEREMSDLGSFSAPPVASAGVVYVGGDDYVRAVAQSNGRRLWRVPVGSGDYSSPALSDELLFVAYGCPDIRALDRQTGSRVWQHTEGCSGGGGVTTALHGGRLYVHPWGYVMDPPTGEIVDRFTSDTIPAFGDRLNVYVDDGIVSGFAPASTEAAWRFETGHDATSAPLVVTSTVYVATAGGTVFGLDEGTGDLVWSGSTGHPVRPYFDGRPFPTPGLGAGEGMLFVPGETRLSAFGPAG